MQATPRAHTARCRIAPMKSLLLTLSLCLITAQARSQDKEPNNGTDPTRLTTTAVVAYEYNDLAGDVSRHAPRLDLTLPFGEKHDYSIRLRVPVVSNDVLGDSGFGVGDVSLMATHVFGLTQKRGMVAQGELVFDSASRDELGTGRHVFKGTFIYAKFMSKGIFAPALVQSIDVGGNSNRADVNQTTIDFYYVPKLANARAFMTIDPAINIDWERDAQFGSLAVTAGSAVGKAFGGLAQVYVKPTVMFGKERPGDWGIEVGVKVLGF